MNNDAARVSVIIPAFNLARYLPAAIDSALGQNSPGGPVEVIVVDDGSTDETPRVLDDYSGRVRVIRQRNRGLVAAVDRGLAAVSGEYIALLDADDEWPRDRLRRHVAILDANPLLGLVHGDMEIIDADGQTLHPSFFKSQGVQPTDGRVLGRLLAGNFISGGASTFRSSLLAAIHPIAPDAAYPDWWIAACIAAVAEITHDDAISNRYRSHGQNMGLGSGPERQPAIQRLELPWRRWMMWNLLEDDSVTVGDTRAALRAWTFGLTLAAADEPRGARALLRVDHESAGLGATGHPRPGTPISKTLLRALSRDPFDGATAVDLEIALVRDAALPHPPPAPPLIALESRPRLTIAWLDELVACPALLHAFAAEAANDGATTLGVLVRPDSNINKLIAQVASEGLTNDDRCDLVLVPEPATTPARAWLAARAQSTLTQVRPPEPYSALIQHDSAQHALQAS
jgi:Glycosyl transferase family 2